MRSKLHVIGTESARLFDHAYGLMRTFVASRRTRAALYALLVVGIAGSQVIVAQAQTAAQQPVELADHVLNALSQASPRVASATAADEPVTITIVLRYGDRAGLVAFIQSLGNQPGSSRRYLSPRELTDRFSPSQSSYDAILSYLQSYGFVLTEGSANRLTITVAGTRGNAERAFNTQIADYQLGTRTFRANQSNPKLPAQIGSAIHAVVGLSNYAVQTPRMKTVQVAAMVGDGAAALVNPARTPMAFATAYNFQGVAGATGAGQRVGIVSFDTFTPSDVTDWLAFVTLPTSRFGQVSEVKINGGVATPGSGQGEVLLDIDTILGMAPGATIVSYASPNGTSEATVFNRMINDNVDVISDSWGNCESQHTRAEIDSLDAVLVAAVAQGMTVFVASGDHQDSCNTGSGLIPNDSGYPNNLVNVTSVGGTRLQVNAGSGTYLSESWWNASDGTGGGFGVSGNFQSGAGIPRPTYQNGFTNSPTRSSPDVSANADPATGMVVCQGGCNPSSLTGGTSMAAPEWAAGMALINQSLGHRVGNLNTALYQAGNTVAFHAPSSMTSTGNDFAHVGLGSFDLANLRAVLSGSAIPPTALPTATLVTGDASQALTGPFNLIAAPGQQAQFTVTFKNTGNSTWTTSGGYVMVEVSSGTTFALTTCDPTPPGITCTKNINASIPAGTALGTVFNFSFRMRHNGALFGDTITAVLTASATPLATATSTLVPTATRTATATPPAGATATRTATATVPAGTTIGGRNFTIAARNDGAQLTWQGGTAQTGYTIIRLAGGVLGPLITLPASATSHLDQTTQPGMNCYLLQPQGTSPQSNSDVVCYTRFRSTTPPPENFTLALNQTAIANLNWSAPAGGGQDSFRVVGFGLVDITVGPSVNSRTLPTNGLTCYAVGAMNNSALTGYTDQLCALPGFTNMSAAPATGQKAASVLP